MCYEQLVNLVNLKADPPPTLHVCNTHRRIRKGCMCISEVGEKVHQVHHNRHKCLINMILSVVNLGGEPWIRRFTKDLKVHHFFLTTIPHFPSTPGRVRDYGRSGSRVTQARVTSLPSAGAFPRWFSSLASVVDHRQDDRRVHPGPRRPSRSNTISFATCLGPNATSPCQCGRRLRSALLGPSCAPESCR